VGGALSSRLVGVDFGTRRLLVLVLVLVGSYLLEKVSEGAL
jgi:hypothetical protein